MAITIHLEEREQHKSPLSQLGYEDLRLILPLWPHDSRQSQPAKHHSVRMLSCAQLRQQPPWQSAQMLLGTWDWQKLSNPQLAMPTWCCCFLQMAKNTRADPCHMQRQASQHPIDFGRADLNASHRLTAVLPFSLVLLTSACLTLMNKGSEVNASMNEMKNPEAAKQAGDRQPWSRPDVGSAGTICVGNSTANGSSISNASRWWWWWILIFEICHPIASVDGWHRRFSTNSQPNTSKVSIVPQASSPNHRNAQRQIPWTF